MARYKPYDYDQLLMIPVSLEDQLAPGTVEYAIQKLRENRFDSGGLDERYKDDETDCSIVGRHEGATYYEAHIHRTGFSNSPGACHHGRNQRAN